MDIAESILRELEGLNLSYNSALEFRGDRRVALLGFAEFVGRRCADRRFSA
jgi:hypothetical protein